MDGLFGKRLREQRQLKGYTLEVLAEKSRISTNYLGDVERGKKSVSLETLQKLASALDISADALLRDNIPAASYITDAEIAEKLSGLTPHQKKAALDILDAYISNLPLITHE